MAVEIETISNEEKVVLLAAANSDTNTRLADQNVVQFGTNRKSEMVGIIGDNGQSWEKLYTEFLQSL